MHGGGTAVLRVLDHGYHEKGDDGGRRVDDELPSIAEAEQWPGRRPYDDSGNGDYEGDWAPRERG